MIKQATFLLAATALFGTTYGLAAEPQIAVGRAHTLALAANGTLYAWGDNSRGQLGTGDKINRDLAVEVPLAGSRVTSIAARDDVSMALREDGTVWMWGSHESGLLGAASLVADREAPAQVGNLGVTRQIRLGRDAAYAVAADGVTSAWGPNRAGGLANGTFEARATPQVVMGIPALSAIYPGDRHTLALATTGQLLGWGAQESGQLCNKDRADMVQPEFMLRPVDITTVGRVTKAAAAGRRSLFGVGNAVTVCGASDALAVCHEREAGSGVPFIGMVRLPTTYMNRAEQGGSLAGYAEASYWLDAEGRIVSCGSNSSGELGKGARTGPISTAAPILTLSDMIGVGAGDRFAVGLRRDGAVFAWGENSAGQLGSALVSEPIANPTRVRTLSGVLELGIDPVGDPDNDGMPNATELEQGTNPFVADNQALAETEAGFALFIRQQYRDQLKREASRVESVLPAEQIAAGTTTRARAAATVLQSSEYENSTGAITRLYFATYLRVPDAGGHAFWNVRPLSGQVLSQTAAQFASAPEFVQRYGNLGDRAFVEQLYRNILGREGDAGGVNYWTGEVEGRRITRGNLLLAFSESPEYRARTRSWLLVSGIYLGMLRRAPTQSEFDSGVARLAANESLDRLIEPVISTMEYARRF
jgi:alpha-tubulin suppressor-like RCC1 family protein